VFQLLIREFMRDVNHETRNVANTVLPNGRGAVMHEDLRRGDQESCGARSHLIVRHLVGIAA
jgi:hypothetical protein